MAPALDRQIREHVASFIAGGESRADFRDWFVHATSGFPHYADPILEDMTGEVELAFAEASNGVFDDEDLRRELAHLAADHHSETVMDVNSTFDGRLESEGTIRLKGTISGEVICHGLLVIDEGATARSRVEAHDAIVRGTLLGDIACSGRLLLARSAVTSGTVMAATLVVEAGATMSGAVAVPGAPSDRIPASPTPQRRTSQLPVEKEPVAMPSGR